MIHINEKLFPYINTPFQLALKIAVAIGIFAYFDEKDKPFTSKPSLSISVGILIFIIFFITFIIISFIIYFVSHYLIHPKNNLKTKPYNHIRKMNKKEINLLINKIKYKFEKTKREYIAIKANPTKSLNLWDSKFGGFPYLPKDTEYPKTPSGEYLFLLAQINFKDVPHIENFPKEGILQFYIPQAMPWGLKFEKGENNIGNDTIKILFLKNIKKNPDNLYNDFSFLPQKTNLPILETQLSLSFKQKHEHISMNDFRFNKLIGNEILEKINYYSNYLAENFNIYIDGKGHKLGGYPSFTQWDPRERLHEKDKDTYELLFQMDSQTKPIGKGYSILWGDVGIANFFIKTNDLKKLKFDKVLYNWDCC